MHRFWRGSIGMAAAALLLVGGTAEAKVLEKLGVTVGGGMGGYTGGLGRDALPGGVWSVRADAPTGNRLRVGFAYEGSANQLGLAAADIPPLLVRHAGAMTFRLDAGSVVRPWIETGVGMSHLSIVRGDAGTFRPDLAAELPLATGVEVRAGLVSAGFRVGYNLMFDNEAAPEAGTGMWSGGLTLGARF